MIRSGNPTLRGDVFGVPSSAAYGGGRARAIDTPGEGSMTIQGTANKSFILIALAMLTAFYTWSQFFAGNTSFVMTMAMVGSIGGLVVGLATVFKKTWAPFTAPVYALLQGLALGGLSAVAETRVPGVVIQAVGLTFAVFLGLLLAYKSRMIRATENFKLGVTAMTGGILIFYLITFVVGLFGVPVSFLHDSSPLSIGISVVVSAVAALNLVMDFDFIESGEAQRAPKYLEWYGAFGLVVTLVWLYLELLRLLTKLQSRE